MTSSKPVNTELAEAERAQKAGEKLTYQQASLLKLPWDDEQTRAYSADQIQAMMKSSPAEKKSAAPEEPATKAPSNDKSHLPW